ncbi:putative wd repeat domain-containing protein [Golovinomyces cichoracearum]|uniref:Putative wd repeat domain-containing protein n=1 Tax=Golovinomyces cichoracearum TaxID=62708 RepID=A0A420HFZ9_9PEZI|nr:putative wd repeat domain-containing protein [Golovinomyces cichoracearum]
MEPKWLDTLSEDWNSSHGSATLPGHSNITPSHTCRHKYHPSPSRIPKIVSNKMKTKEILTQTPIEEIPANENNLSGHTHTSKSLNNTIRKGNGLTRPQSACSTSTQYCTINRKQRSHSLANDGEETPEWRRRLLYEDFPYGEQLDLFSGPNLKNIFVDPLSNVKSRTKVTVPIYEKGGLESSSSLHQAQARNMKQNQADFNTSLCTKNPDFKIQETLNSKNGLTDENLLGTDTTSFNKSKFAQDDQNSLNKPEYFSARREENSEFDDCTGRSLSGQSVSRNEQLSQIFLTKQLIRDGSSCYTTTDSPHHGIEECSKQIEEESPKISSKGQVSQFGNLDTNSRSIYDNNSKNSKSGSIQKLDLSQENPHPKKQQLATVSLLDESALLTEESMLASTPKDLKKDETDCIHRSNKIDEMATKLPQTPHSSPIKARTDEVTKKSTSPLKIFGTYDTFTNDILHRRVSQFESEAKDNNCEYSNCPGPESRQGQFLRNFENVVSYERTQNIQSKTKMQQGDFGVRDPNHLRLVKEVSYISGKSNFSQDMSGNSNEQTLETTLNSAKNCKFYPSAQENKMALPKRKIDQSNINIFNKIQDSRKIEIPTKTPFSTKNPIVSDSEELVSSKNRNRGFDGKRSPKTPLRHPESKRRRTLQMIELNGTPKQISKTERKSPGLAHQKKYSSNKGEQKNFNLGNDLLAEDTKSQSKSSKSEKSIHQNVDQKEPKSLETSRSEHSENNLDQEVSSFRNNQSIAELPQIRSKNTIPNEQLKNSYCKGSVTTNDFLNEAKVIMACLRGRARSHSKLESEGSIEKNLSEDILNDSYQESTQEPFSRPPSREKAVPVPRPSHQQDDPALLDHLRKYQENFDIHDVLVSSLKSIAEVKEVSEVAKEIDRLTEEKIFQFSSRRASVLGNSAENSSSCALISRYQVEKINHPPPNMLCQSALNNDFPSFRSNTTSSQWIPAGSSKESDSRRVIVPESVSHLIPEQLAGMVFDRDRNTWIKNKYSNCDKISSKPLNPEATDDDPFGDIPDLSIDESLERERIRQVSLKKKEEKGVTDIAHANPSQQHSFASKNLSGIKASISDNFELILDPNMSPGPSGDAEIHRYGPKQIAVEKPLNEENNGISLKNSLKSQFNPYQIKSTFSYSKVRPRVSKFEDEISIGDDRVNPSQTPNQRNITILFSSPIASFIDCKEHKEGFGAYSHEGNVRDSDESLEVAGNKNRLLNNDVDCQRSSSTEFIPSQRISCEKSVGVHHFPARTISRIDERDEKPQPINDKNLSSKSFSIVLANKKSPGHVRKTYTTPQPSREIGTLTLTPLPDFTFHQVDESLGLDVSYLAQNQRPNVGKTKKALSLSIKELVEKITEIEPYEPFWEHLKEMNLKGKRLKNVHKLDNFCQTLTELDLSHNQISFLDGVPSSLQIIRITNNCLSDMTAWGHLTNLQYIDVSSNNLESLSSLKCLVHLRSLRADNNRITSLKGIDQLSGLLNLRLRNNFVCNLDFHNTKLQLLTDLDLRNNKVSKLQNIQQLQSLAHLDLVNNCLDEFLVNTSGTIESIKYLRLSGNNLRSIHVGHYPNLRLLYLDRNCLGKVTGLLKTKYLDSLSLREQRNSIIDPCVISEAFEVRKLFLSGNFLNKFKPESDFLNLQLLEMASCGLESLPEGFGSMLANVRVLNLNFNSLIDIGPISGILRLKRLHLAGNRLIGLEGLGRLLSQLPTLSLVDIRSNPLTLGFYSPLLVKGANPHDLVSSDVPESQEPYTLGKMDRIKDKLYESCLDMRTRMKRRIYEMNLLRSSRIKILDGLAVDRSILFSADKVYHSMVEAGFITPLDLSAGKTISKSGSKVSDVNEVSGEVCRDDEIWQAEDSFG